VTLAPSFDLGRHPVSKLGTPDLVQEPQSESVQAGTSVRRDLVSLTSTAKLPNQCVGAVISPRAQAEISVDNAACQTKLSGGMAVVTEAAGQHEDAQTKLSGGVAVETEAAVQHEASRMKLPGGAAAGTEPVVHQGFSQTQLSGGMAVGTEPAMHS